MGRLPERCYALADSHNFLSLPAKGQVFAYALLGFNLNLGRIDISHTFVECRHLCGHNVAHCSSCTNCAPHFWCLKKNRHLLVNTLACRISPCSPFLVNAVPTYLHENSSAPGVQGVGDINSAILSTRILPLEYVLPLFLIILAFALFSKKYSGRFFTLPTLLLSMWLFVPLFLTQGYLFGFIIDYNRFLYFIIFPTIIFIAVLINHGAEFFPDIAKTYRWFQARRKKQKKT